MAGESVGTVTAPTVAECLRAMAEEEAEQEVARLWVEFEQKGHEELLFVPEEAFAA